MKVSINQPAYLPWLGYFDRINTADLHIVLDHVQFEKNSFVNRNKILTNNGAIWLTVPLETHGKFKNLPIHQVNIDNSQPWAKKHLASIQQNYSKALFFEDYFPTLSTIYDKEWKNLSQLMRATNSHIIDWLGIDTPIIYSSDLDITGTGSELILNLCTQVEATTYLSGALGRDYLKCETFDEAGIKIMFQDYQHPTYQQKFEEFVPYMCILDLLFNCGENSCDTIKAGRNFIA